MLVLERSRLMNFSEALQVMKNGKKVKRKIWDGYWYWDSTKETIMMRTKDNEVLDIRETQKVEYTLSHIFADDWIEATTENCPVLGGELTFGFGTALQVGNVSWGDSVRDYVLSSTDIVAKDWMFFHD